MALHVSGTISQWFEMVSNTDISNSQTTPLLGNFCGYGLQLTVTKNLSVSANLSPAGMGFLNRVSCLLINGVTNLAAL